MKRFFTRKAVTLGAGGGIHFLHDGFSDSLLVLFPLWAGATPGKVAEYQTQLVRVLAEDFLDHRFGALALGALEIAEHDEGYGGVVGSSGRAGCIHMAARRI